MWGRDVVRIRYLLVRWERLYMMEREREREREREGEGEREMEGERGIERK